MPISFNDVPSDIRTPGVFVEFDGSRAVGGPQVQPYKLLVAGQKVGAGTVAALTPVTVTSVAQAREFFGKKSMLHGMARALFKNQRIFDLTMIAVDDDGGGVAATKTFTISGTAATGTLFLYVGGRRITVKVTTGDTAATIAGAIRTAVQAVDDVPVTATGATDQVILTADNKGAEGNGITVSLDYFQGEDSSQTGVVFTPALPTTLAGGSGNPDISAGGQDLFGALGETHYNVLVLPWSDTANAATIDTELADRWGPLRQIEGIAVNAKHDTFANLQTYGAARNSKHITTLGFDGALGGTEAPWEWAAAYGGILSFYGRQDPARPFQTLPFRDLKAPAVGNRFTMAERDLLYRDGISAFTVDAGGLARIDRAITHYQTTSNGAPDTAFLDVNTPLTLGYLRFDFRRRMLTRYPRHKVAADGTRFGAGQAIITPKIGRAEAIAAFRDWESIGLVEGFDQFKTDLIVERNLGDPNRLDFLLAPDLVNQLRVVGAKIEFRL